MNLKHRIYRLFFSLKQRAYRLFSMIIVCLAAVFGLNLSVFADVAYVDGSVVACDNDGTTWGNAFKYLQDALDEASEFGSTITQIWVKAGQYFVDQSCANEVGTGDRAETFQLVKDVFLLGGFDGTETLPEQRDPVANPTFLSGIVADSAPFDGCEAIPGLECGTGGDCFEPCRRKRGQATLLTPIALRDRLRPCLASLARPPAACVITF